MAAYDGYRSQPDPQQPTYPSTYDPAYDPRTYPSSSYYQNPQYQDAARPRSRASSTAASEGVRQPAQQPLNNALNHAFDKSDAARTVDPELIAQITAEVKRSVLDEIKLNGVGGVGVTGQSQPGAVPPQQQYMPQSPSSTSASFPTRNVYTPPSPTRHADYSSHGSASPDPLARDPMFDGAGDRPNRRLEKTAPVDIPNDKVPKSRPAPVQRMSTETDFTPIEKMWQRMFDPQGQPTPRLGQFLRGLAVHLIDDYEPKKSLVIPPSKMLQFYNDVRLPDEIYPWSTIFGELPYATLSKLYREMRCQHHLIQENPYDVPQVPALTPQGFQEWMTAMIQAYPDTEYERMSKTVLDMPISNADDCKERFPKELPRRLFPYQENLQAQQRCAAVLSAEGVGPLRRAPTFPPPPPMSQGSMPPPSLERERSPYAARPGVSDSKVFDSEEDDNEPLAKPIERERKPYAAAPGGGKIHEDDLSRSTHSETAAYEQRSRAQSTASQSQYPPQPNGSQSQHHPRTASNVNGRRPRSPSFSNYGTRSDPNVRDVHGSYYSSNAYDSEEEKRRFARDAEMKRKDWARRQAEEDTTPVAHNRRATGLSDSSYESQPRASYDEDYHRSRSSTNGYDNRGYEPRRYG